ncbi:DUF86 domain-containing protein [bacterium]|nr:MAG: DUF86 domain-containing protein [bacterium]MCL4232680.1 DUF86 domain-containing protein [Dehalococcoidia bacterium]
MQLEAGKYLYDLEQAAALVTGFVAGRPFAEFEADPMLRSAVERQFEIMGEATSRLAKTDASAASQIPDARRMVAFRNILIHGYAEVDPRILWGVAESNLPMLIREVADLLDDN